MEMALSASATSITTISTISAKPLKNPSQTSSSFISFPVKFPNRARHNLSTLLRSCASFSTSSTSKPTKTKASSSTLSPTSSSSSASSSSHQRHWMVLVEAPPGELNSKPEIIDYYVKTLKSVLGSEKDAQVCIYNASCKDNFGFCCDIDEDAAYELAALPGVLFVTPDPDFNSIKDYSCSDVQLKPSSSPNAGSSLLVPLGTSRHWLVRTDNPGSELVSKADIVNFYVQILTKVLGNERDAQTCMYHVSWQTSYGFCCELDDSCAQDLAGVPGVLSVQLDENFGSDDKDYRGLNVKQISDTQDSSSAKLSIYVKTKKLFVTGLSFYTSEKTLRAAFEGFGELVEVKIIMDKISKRSKGYAFVEYTTEEAASTALQEMNGKIINGWMITVDVAKKNPVKYGRERSRSAS